MEELIKLLNEYDDWMVSRYEEYFSTEWLFVTNAGQLFREEFILGKRYWFIKRLIDNDKIDFESQAMQYVKSDLSKFFAEWEDKNWMSDDYAMLLMLLSIQDNPIEFLISVLR